MPRTIEEIKALCEIVPYDSAQSKKQHWIWTAARNKHGNQPVCRAPDYTNDPSGQVRTQPVRRAIRHIQTGAAIPRGINGYRVCTVEGCVSPDCTRWMTKVQHGKFLRKDGRHVGMVCKVLAASKAAAKIRKVTPEQHQIMLSDPRPAYQVAEEMGVHPSTVTWHRAGKTRPPGNPLSGLFQGLLR